MPITDTASLADADHEFELPIDGAVAEPRSGRITHATVEPVSWSQSPMGLTPRRQARLVKSATCSSMSITVDPPEVRRLGSRPQCPARSLGRHIPVTVGVAVTHYAGRWARGSAEARKDRHERGNQADGVN